MSELIHLASKSRALLHAPSLEEWQRVPQALQALSGLDLTGIPDRTREQLEADIVKVNRELAKYPIEKDDDYQIISDVDLQRILDQVDAATSRAIASELDRIVAELDDGVEKLPEQAIREAREHRDLMIPRLIDTLREAIREAQAGKVPEGNAHFIGLFLLTEFHAQESFPTILEAISLPSDLPFDLFGDAITSTLARILAEFAGGSPEQLDTLIANTALNEYVRWEAAQSYALLVRDGRLRRSEAVERLKHHLRQAIDDDDEAVVGGLICELDSFAPVEAIDEIKEAYARNLVDPFLIRIESVERSIAEGKERVLRSLQACDATGIEDTIKELRRWAAFTEKPDEPDEVSSPRSPSILEPDESVEATFPSRDHRVGRNEPCPCGSGKKYKKCCGSRG